MFIYTYLIKVRILSFIWSEDRGEAQQKVQGANAQAWSAESNKQRATIWGESFWLALAALIFGNGVSKPSIRVDSLAFRAPISFRSLCSIRYLSLFATIEAVDERVEASTTRGRFFSQNIVDTSNGALVVRQNGGCVVIELLSEWESRVWISE